MCQNYVKYQRFDVFNTKSTIWPMLVKIMMMMKIVTAIVTVGRCSFTVEGSLDAAFLKHRAINSKV